MIYEVWFENGWQPWCAFRTTDEQEAQVFFKNASQPNKWLYIFTDKGDIWSINGVKLVI